MRSHGCDRGHRLRLRCLPSHRLGSSRDSHRHAAAHAASPSTSRDRFPPRARSTRAAIESAHPPAHRRPAARQLSAGLGRGARRRAGRQTAAAPRAAQRRAASQPSQARCADSPTQRARHRRRQPGRRAGRCSWSSSGARGDFRPPARSLLPKEAVELLGRAPLAGRQQMQLVRVGNKLLLVALSPAGAETLTEITEPDGSRAPRRPLPPRPAGQRLRRVPADAEPACQRAGRRADSSAPRVPHARCAMKRSRAALSACRARSGCCVSTPVAARSSSLRPATPPASPLPRSLPDPVAEALRGGPESWTSPERLSSTLQVMLLLTVLSLAPAILLMTTSFVRIVVVLGLLAAGDRHAAASAQPGHDDARPVHDAARHGADLDRSL